MRRAGLVQRRRAANAQGVRAKISRRGADVSHEQLDGLPDLPLRDRTPIGVAKQRGATLLGGGHRVHTAKVEQLCRRVDECAAAAHDAAS